MKPTDSKPQGLGTDIVKRSFEKETDGTQRAATRRATRDEERRSILGAPVDPNSSTTSGTFPPGVRPEDVVDPGRATPGSPPPENRSGDADDPEQKAP
jgi:hypothetical protein